MPFSNLCNKRSDCFIRIKPLEFERDIQIEIDPDRFPGTSMAGKHDKQGKRGEPSCSFEKNHQGVRAIQLPFFVISQHLY
jgi:hypothetical protein